MRASETSSGKVTIETLSSVSIAAKLPPGLRVVEAGEGLPPLPDGSVVLVKGRSITQPLADVLAEIIRQTFSVA